MFYLTVKKILHPKPRNSMFASNITHLGFFLPPLPQLGLKPTSVQVHLFWGTLNQDPISTELPQPRHKNNKWKQKRIADTTKGCTKIDPMKKKSTLSTLCSINRSSEENCWRKRKPQFCWGFLKIDFSAGRPILIRPIILRLQRHDLFPTWHFLWSLKNRYVPWISTSLTNESQRKV